MSWLPLLAISGLTTAFYNMLSGEERRAEEDVQRRRYEAEERRRRDEDIARSNAMFERELAIEREVSSPAYQVGELQKAGLNPYAFMSGLGTGDFQVPKQTFVPSTTGRGYTPTPDNESDPMGMLSGVLDLVSSFNTMMIQDQQMIGLDLQNKVKEVNYLAELDNADVNSGILEKKLEQMKLDVESDRADIAHKKELTKALYSTEDRGANLQVIVNEILYNLFSKGKVRLR